MNDPLMLSLPWRYVSPWSKFGGGQVHHILTALGGVVVTTTLFTEDNGTEADHSWIGTIEEFQAQFTPLIP